MCARAAEKLGYRVTVLEARDRVGGRVYTLESGAEAGARTAPSPATPDVHRGGRTHAWERYVTDRVRADLRRFERRVRSLRPSPALDRRSAGWLVRELRLVDRARFLVTRDLRDTYAVEPEYLSLLFLVQQARARPTTVPIRGRADHLPLALARGLDIRLEEPAAHIERRASGVSVNDLDADAAVVTVPVPVLATIAFEPALPPTLAAAEQLAYGHGVVTLLQYAKPSVANVVSDLTFQTASRRGRIVRAYTAGRNGLLLGSVSRRTRPLLVADELDEVYPGSRADYESGETYAWHLDGWSLGTGVAYAPGQVNRFQAVIRRPLGRLHFAGEHTDALAGTMEGALRSGRRAAAAVARG